MRPKSNDTANAIADPALNNPDDENKSESSQSNNASTPSN
jgi:hypothetical protein